MTSGLLQMLMQRFGGGPSGGAPRRPFMPMPMPRQMPMPEQVQMPGQGQGPSIFDLLRPPQQMPQFNVQNSQGTKPKNYIPAQVSMSDTPMPAVFNMPGAGAMPSQFFNVTPSSGTKPKNFRPAQIQMNAPSPAGPAAMQQMLALMGGGFGATPFSPFGQGQG